MEKKMKDFWVDFSGSMLIIHNCENEEDKEAKEIFFKILNSHNKNYENKIQYCEIDGIEERG